MAVFQRLLLFVLWSVAVQAKQETICEQKGEYIRCPFGQVLDITHVQYGRTQLGLCNPYNVPNLVTNCRSTSISTNTVKRLCNKRSLCFLQADNTILGEDPCNNIPKYLVVDFTCYTPTTTTRTPPTTTSTTTPTTPTTMSTTSTTSSTPTTSTTTPSTSTSTSTSTMTPTTTRQATTAPFVPYAPVNAPNGTQICHDYLVSGPHGVKDAQLSASSVFSSKPDDHGPTRGRLYSDAINHGGGRYDRGAWSAGVNDQMQYIQVELNKPSIIRGVTTQGRHVNPQDLCCYQRVRRYRVLYSIDGYHWDTVKDDQGRDKIFNGNTDQDTPVTNMLPCPVMARYVRINPVDWVDHVSLRFDLLGCSANTADVGKCPPGWKENPGNNKCYLVTDVKDMKTWDDADKQCKLQQAELVKIDSIQERDWLRQQMSYLRQTQGQHHFWTGLHNKPRTDSLNHVWQDGTPLDPSIMPWGNGQPDNSGGNEHCDELWDGDMNDNNCKQHYPYICEKDKFWKPPKNIPKVAPVPVPTQRTTVAPATHKIYHLPTPKIAPGSGIGTGLGYMQIGPNIFPTGCLGQPTDCAKVQTDGDYQSCQGCHFYMTCAPNGVFTRPCPARLVWDDNTKRCEARSSTCVGP